MRNLMIETIERSTALKGAPRVSGTETAYRVYAPATKSRPTAMLGTFTTLYQAEQFVAAATGRRLGLLSR